MCERLGHRTVDGGASADGTRGILTFDACLRCGKMLWSGVNPARRM
jgi:hypothetical protein